MVYPRAALRVAVLVPTLVAPAGPAAGQTTRPVTVPHELTVHEAFGVSHPDQVIDFDLPAPVDPAATSVTGPGGRAVPFQVLRGNRLAVRTDLPAGASRTWRAGPGTPAPAGEGAARVRAAGDRVEVTNGLTGVRLPAPWQGGGGRPAPAPVQAVRWRDGSWTAAARADLSVTGVVRDLAVDVVEPGPLKAVVRLRYRVDRPEMRYGDQVIAPAGEGFYSCTVELQAGQPSVLLEEETDCDASWSVDLYGGLRPTQARYRGHHAREARFGREPDGRAYRQWHVRPPVDATVDLRYDRPAASGHASGDGSWRRMVVWDPWAFDSGWYWVLYDAAAGDASNVAGIFAGPAGRAVGCADSGVGVFTAPASPATGGAPAAGFAVASRRRAPDGRVFPRTRFAWGLFVGTKGADLRAPDRLQPINLQMNLHGGVNLNKVHRVGLDYPDPKPGYGALFMEKPAVDRLIAGLRADKAGPHGDGVYGRLYRGEPTSRDLIDFWADPSGRRGDAARAAVTKGARDLLDALVNGGGIYDMPIHYWHGGLQMSRAGVWLDALLADPRTPPDDRRRLKAVAALYGAILWDEDFVPLAGAHGLNLGTPNMPVQQQGYRDLYALFLADHPGFRDRADGVERRTLEAVRAVLHESGANIGCPHYVAASMAPTLANLLRLRVLGRDHFATEPRLARFAEFYMQLLTPPEVRFGGARKLVAVGDGSTEASELLGVLATGFRDADPALSARLTGAWRRGGSKHSGFFATTVAMIDEAAAGRDPALGSAAFPGYLSVLRHGWGTGAETAAWVVDGDFYRDHYHEDLGSVALYALGAPLSLDWGPTYEPRAAGAYYHNVVVPESRLRHAWDADAPPPDPFFRWGRPRAEKVSSAPGRSRARATFDGAWTRTVTLVHGGGGDGRDDPPRAAILIRDTFAGAGAGAAKVFTLNLAAAGAVDTPAGRLVPEPRTWDHRDPARRELASAGRPFALRPGLNRLGFAGQWGVDFDVYVVPDGEQQALVGNWAHTWHPQQEQAEFEKAHGPRFEERQHILRLRGNGGFAVLIVPYRRGAVRPTVELSGGALPVRYGRGGALDVRLDE